MQVKKVKVGYLEENCYVVEHNNECIVIDPGADYFLIKPEIGKSKVLCVLLTHGHEDHTSALEELLKEHKVPVFSMNNLDEKKYVFSNFKFEVFYTPGHTLDSTSYYFYEYGCLFVGDFIFKGSIGRTDKGGNDDLMNISLVKLSKYKLTTKLYPGHGDATTISYELENNPFLKRVV